MLRQPPGIKLSLHHQSLCTEWDFFISANPFLGIDAWMDLPYISLSSAVRPTLQALTPIQSSTSFSQDIFGLPLFLWPSTFPSSINFSSVCYVSEINFFYFCSGVFQVWFQMWLRVHQLCSGLFCVQSTMLES